MTQKTYRESFKGYFAGMLQWKQFDNLWDVLKSEPEGWYVYQPLSGDTPPENTMPKDEFLAFLQTTDDFLHEQHFADYCGVVYADSSLEPTFIKVFHPRKMGSGCALGDEEKEPILPHWTITRIQPELMVKPEEEPKSFMQKIGLKS